MLSDKYFYRCFSGEYDLGFLFSSMLFPFFLPNFHFMSFLAMSKLFSNLNRAKKITEEQVTRNKGTFLFLATPSLSTFVLRYDEFNFMPQQWLVVL